MAHNFDPKPSFPKYLVPHEYVENQNLEKDHAKAWKEYCKNDCVEDTIVPDWDSKVDLDDCWDLKYGIIVTECKNN